MKLTLTDYQLSAVDRVIKRITSSQEAFADGEYSAIVLSAVTGAGKTVIATAVIEQLLEGGDLIADPNPETTILWVTSDPTLNAQTLEKMEHASDRLGGLGRFRTITAGKGINQETFDPGSITFLNTQAASKSALIAKKSDYQRYTIWETISNSVTRFGANFIVFIDEAHRGVEKKRDRDTDTIINKIVNGPVPVPVIVGISATAAKFKKAIETAIDGEPRTARPVTVDVADVQRSGIIKDRIVLHNPASSVVEALEADTTLIRAGVQKTREFEAAWAAYCEAESEAPVIPAMVIQVQDLPTDDDLREIVDAVLDEWPGLTERAFVNTFADHQTLDLGSGRAITYMQPHHIQDASDVRVILAKNAITTGWDCPRAEVLVSLRTAHDHTYIAQLIGRTIRQPLARRIESDETLNKVACYLPRFDAAGVAAVVNQFKAEGDDSLNIDIVRATFGYSRAQGIGNVFDLLSSLPSYKIPSRIETPGVKRLHRLATCLTTDEVRTDATDEAKRLLNIELDAISARMVDLLDARKKEVESVGLDNTEITTSGESVSSRSKKIRLKRDRNNIDDVYRKAARTLKDGVAEDYWQYLVAKDDSDVLAHKVTVAALGTLIEAGESLEDYAHKLTSDWLHKYGKAISELPEGRRANYDAIRGQARFPELSTITVPAVIEEVITVTTEQAEDEKSAVLFAQADFSNRFDKHLYVDPVDDKYYAPTLRPLEREVLESATSDDSWWYRNPPSGTRSLTIPYEKVEGRWAGMHPDFLQFQEGTDGQISVSIVDPHGTHFEDALPKLRGLANYAELHGKNYRSIMAIDRIDGHILGVPVHDETVRKNVIALIDAGKSAKEVFAAAGVPFS